MSAPATLDTIPLPVVLRKEDQLVTALFDEKAATLRELPESVFTGDYRECEVCFSEARPNLYAHASTTHVRCCLMEAASGGGVATKVLFEAEMPHVVIDMRFSPKATYLVTYAVMDPKRTPGGNLSVFEVATGRLLRRGMQARWPAMTWTSDEDYVVRPVQGWMHVLDGNLAQQQQPAATGAAAAADAAVEEGESGEEGAAAASPTMANGAALSKVDLMLAQDKEIEYSTSPAPGLPILALFKPFYKNRQGTFLLYRLPNLRDAPMYQLNFGRAEGATMHWSRHSGKHLALLVGTQRDPSGKSYYGYVTLHLVDVMARSVVDVKLRGEGETVHDCRWCPTRDELLVVHGRMPRNKATLFSSRGVPLRTFGEAPRNLVHWAPNGSAFVLGGSGNLAGDFQFYTNKPDDDDNNNNNSTATSSTGSFNEKCSFQSWAPDSHNFLCSTVFTRLRMDNKLRFVRNNGSTVLVERFKILYGAHWVALRPYEAYPDRPVSPRSGEEEEKPKPQVYRPPGGASRAAAMLRRSDDDTATAAKPVLPVGAAPLVKKGKKGKKR